MRRWCGTCEWCRWEPDRDCGQPEHERCPTCGHCLGRHELNRPDPWAKPFRFLLRFR